MKLQQNGRLNLRGIEPRHYLLTDTKHGNGWPEDYENKVILQISNFTEVLSKLWTESKRNINKFRELNKEFCPPKVSIPTTVHRFELFSLSKLLATSDHWGGGVK